jgi:hypothetical protein
MLPITDDSVGLIILITSCLTSNYPTFLLSPKWISLRLAIHGYHQTNFTPGLWRHVTRPIQFTLVVGD